MLKSFKRNHRQQILLDPPLAKGEERNAREQDGRGSLLRQEIFPPYVKGVRGIWGDFSEVPPFNRTLKHMRET